MGSSHTKIYQQIDPELRKIDKDMRDLTCNQAMYYLIEFDVSKEDQFFYALGKVNLEQEIWFTQRLCDRQQPSCKLHSYENVLALVNKVYENFNHRLWECQRSIIGRGLLSDLLKKSLADGLTSTFLFLLKLRPLDISELREILKLIKSKKLFSRALAQVEDLHQALVLHHLNNGGDPKIMAILTKQKGFIFPIEAAQATSFYKRKIAEGNLTKIQNIFLFYPPSFSDCVFAQSLKNQALAEIFAPYYNVFQAYIK